MSGGESSHSRSLSASASDVHAQLRRKSGITTTSERMGARLLASRLIQLFTFRNPTVVINDRTVVFCNQYGLRCVQIC